MWAIANTADSIISHTTTISIAYLASPDSSGSLGIIIYFLRRKYPAGKAAKPPVLCSVVYNVELNWPFGIFTVVQGNVTDAVVVKAFVLFGRIVCAAYMRPIATDVARSVVRLSVCLSILFRLTIGVRGGRYRKTPT